MKTLFVFVMGINLFVCSALSAEPNVPINPYESPRGYEEPGEVDEKRHYSEAREKTIAGAVRLVKNPTLMWKHFSRLQIADIGRSLTLAVTPMDMLAMKGVALPILSFSNVIGTAAVTALIPATVAAIHGAKEFAPYIRVLTADPKRIRDPVLRAEIEGMQNDRDIFWKGATAFPRGCARGFANMLPQNSRDWKIAAGAAIAAAGLAYKYHSQEIEEAIDSFVNSY